MTRSWTSSGVADQGPRRFMADAASTRYERTNGRYAWSVADGIGDESAAVEAAREASFVAARTAPLAGAAAGIAAARSALQASNNGAPRGQAGDCVMVVVTEMGESVGGGLDIAWVGDCRAYVVRQGELVQVTEDHTQGQAMRGWRDPYWHTLAEGYDHIVTRSVHQDQPIASVRVLGPVERLLLCSDGLVEVLPAETLARFLTGPSSFGLRHTAQRMVELARGAGARDNIAVTLAAPRSRWL
ncbi:PP2C family serine/threonine-protein phosphatase [Streptomyces sp. NBC_01500]|uniref:PP2C family protein-serine/threonine phosphatase n=1 Tax=Streptomyces sp. NBC_01500 TaxID=2903886 RepID=UPI00225048B2|nr:PP2C family serine/threonine-protein phosphatase [Streptomyces sp. NBC_01500]MCX4554213.1 serine/threonine-protein phosphatase [Streptomyces sp. NBC_01500]